MTNGYRRSPYYGGPQGQVGYNRYSSKPDWGSALRELLKNMQMMKQWRQSQEQQKWERGQREKEFNLSRQRADLQLKNLSQGIREQEWGAKKELRLEEEAKAELTPEQYKRWKYKLPELQDKYPKTTVENVRKEFSITPEEWEGLDKRRENLRRKIQEITKELKEIK